MREMTVRVGEGRFRGNDNAVIQRAVDEVAAAGGGAVELPAGTFMMRDALHLRSEVALVGQGPETVLRKVPSVSSPLADYLCYAHHEITLERPEPFEPGMGVLIQDDNAPGVYTTTATLLSREGNAFIIDRMLNHDYNPAAGGRAVSIYPIVAAECARSVRVASLTIDGGGEPERINGCRGGGVFLMQCHTVTLEGVEITGFNGDAISFQDCTDVAVRGCHLHHCAGIGLHPGGGSVRYLLSGNRIHHNGGDGIFYCLRTTHSLCERNQIHDNAGAGITIGERDTNHVIRSNTVSRNAGPAIILREVMYRGADRVLVEDNTFEANGEPAACIAAGIREVTMRGNRFTSVSGAAARVGEGAECIYLVRNTVDGVELGADHVDDASGCVSFQEPPRPLEVGPGSASARDALHLGVELPRRPANFEV